MLFRLIIWSIIFYFIFKFIRRIINVFLLQNNARSSSSNNVHGSGVNNNGQAQAKNHYNISQKDIVEAEFEEIKPEEKTKEEDKTKEKDNPEKD
ncbi:MAG: hypothetical protein ACM3QX_06645 [Syntrophomonadaceae bacterium]